MSGSLHIENRPRREGEAVRSFTGSTGENERSIRIEHSVHARFEDVADLQPEWDRFVESAEGDLFATYDWCRIWWKHYGAGRSLEIHLFRRHGAIVGVVPFFRETLRIGPASLRLIRLVGCDHSVTTAGFVVNPSVGRVVVESLLQQINQGLAWDMIHLGPLPGYFGHREEVAGWFAGQQEVGRVTTHASGEPHIVFDLPASYDDYLKALPSRMRTQVRASRRKLDDLSRAFEDVASSPELDKEFGAFVDQHQRQWTGVGQLGHFADWRDAEAFHREMADVMARRGRLRLFRLTAKGHSIGFQYNYRFGRRAHWILGSREMGGEWDPFRLGTHLLASTIERLIDEGVAQLDAMKGMYDYKIQLGGRVLRLQSITVVRRGVSPAIRVPLSRFAAWMLHLMYYRIWFKRIAPKLPFRRKPLSRLWIRSRID